MPVIPHEEKAFEPSYGILCRRLLGRDGYQTPFGAHQCVVPAGGTSSPHQHHEGEVFFIASGRGTIQIGQEPETPVNSGDVVLIPAHTQHVLKNLSDSEELRFTSVWFHPGGPDQPDPPAQSLIMAAPPTPNGSLHLGHLSGPYLALDAMARIRRQEGCTVATAAGSDDHQTYVVTCAQSRGETPLRTSDFFTSSIRSTLERMQMLPAHWLRPVHDAEYRQRVQDVLKEMLHWGQVEFKEIPTLFNSEGQCLVEAHVSGQCPHCGQATSGNGCEACFVPNICSDLVDPRCAKTGQPAQLRPHGRLVFNLEPFLPRLRSWINGLANKPAWLEQLAQKLLQDPVPTPEFPISHPGDWGIEVPEGLPGAGQRLFAWFEMAIGFFHMDRTGYLVDLKTELMFAFGSDNAWYYLTMLPAVMQCVEPRVQLPKALLTNRFLLLDGSKFSTSRRHAIWGDEALQHLSADFIRLCLASARPEHQESDFSLTAMKQVLQRYAKPWQLWWQTLQSRIDECGGRIPEIDQEWEEFDSGLYQELGQLWRAAQAARQPATFSLRGQLQAAHDCARLGSLLAVGRAPLALAVLSAVVFARLAEPIIPTTAAALCQALEMPLVSDGTLSLPLAGRKLKSIAELRLAESEQLEALIESRQVPA